jgi:hypothetical protein
MHSPAGGVQSDRPNDNYSSVVSDLVSLIEHMQASMKMLEGAIARELPLSGQEAGDNVIVLDDITPCYVKANAALHACKAGLGVALHFLSGAEPRNSTIVELAGSDRVSRGYNASREA